jgi:hypothetical protein
MKKLFTIVFTIACMRAFAQTNPITSINITLPANPDANTVNWGTGSSVFSITTTVKTTGGRIDPSVEESKILVIIKKDGNKICGDYTIGTAPASGFRMDTKVWSGSSAVALLGKGCVLPPGDYNLSLQFWGYNNGKAIALSDEKIKPFTIKGNDQQAYQQPQAISPADGATLPDADIKNPITFKWTPVVPKPQEPVIYRITVWQLMNGRGGGPAIKANTPILTRDVDNITQAIITNLVTGPCMPPYLCDFVWSVQALNKEGKPYGANNGTSEALRFNYKLTDVKASSPAALSPVMEKKQKQKNR